MQRDVCDVVLVHSMKSPDWWLEANCNDSIESDDGPLNQKTEMQARPNVHG